MEFKGTKGDWFLVETSNHPENKGEQVSIIQTNTHAFDVSAVEFNGLTRDQFKANCKLISKAPEMLEFLLELENDMEIFSDLFPNQQQRLLKIIKEATTL